jgi:hypothetical protein
MSLPSDTESPDCNLRLPSSVAAYSNFFLNTLQRVVSWKSLPSGSASGAVDTYFSIRFVPIVALALVFNMTNAIGFTYACVSYPLYPQLPQISPL